MSIELSLSFAPTLCAPVVGVKWVAPNCMLRSEKCEFDLQIGLFFDGTNNNRERDKKALSHSNIARLAMAYPEVPSDGRYRTYVPGAGTIFPEIGELEESSFGSGFAVGCEGRVLYGLLEVINCLYRRVNNDQRYFSKEQLKALCRSGRKFSS
jgi:hypothetical protein